MTIMLRPILVAAVLALASAASAVADEPGAALFKKRCASCHALDANRIGPALGGVIGRQAGTAPGYRYSKSVAASGVVWTPARLDAWLEKPTALIPGAGMPAKVKSPDERKSIIDYLAHTSAPKMLARKG